MNKDLLSVFKRVAAVTNEKIDRVLDDVRALPQNLPHVPGIDLTAGGEYLTYDEAVKLKSKQDGLIAQTLALKSAFASVNSLVMNKNVFYELTEELKLYRIYPVVTGNSYILRCRNNAANFLKYLKEVDVSVEVSNELVKRVLFPDFEITDGRHRWGDYNVSFSITVIPPPEDIRRKIVQVLSDVSTNLTNDKSIVVCTLADGKAFQVQVFEITPAPMSALDPGVVLERGDYAVILTDTFYHVSDLEQQFLDKAEQVAENWQVKRFLLN